MTLPRKVLVIGSGPILIGQAAEFDYAGVQACLALRSAGVETILVNSNPATVMTDPDVGGTVLLGPLTLGVGDPGHRGAPARRAAADARRADRAEPGGRARRCRRARRATASGCSARRSAAVRAAEDRGGFRSLVTGIGEPVPESAVVETRRRRAALRARCWARRSSCGPAFTLGGGGGGFAATPAEARERIAAGLAASPIGQVLVERSLLGWYEIEFEVLRDASDTTIAICGMENLDPMGVHTGDSIVVAPIQTLPDPVVQRLRRCAAEDRARPAARGRLQRPAGRRARWLRLPRHRGQPARQPLDRAGLEGHRLPDRPHRRAGRAGPAAARAAEPGHRRELAPPSSRRSTTSSSSCRAGRSTSSRPPTAASGCR